MNGAGTCVEQAKAVLESHEALLDPPEALRQERRSRGSALRRRVPIVRPQRLLLVAVGLVVVLVSLPLLRSLALKENELDAMRALDLIGHEVFAAEVPARTLGELLHPESMLAARLPDTRLLADGRVMFHHGYLFELVPTPGGGRVLRAWPLVHGRTGLGAFWSSSAGRLLGHPNSAATWSGLGAAPSLELDEAASPAAFPPRGSASTIEPMTTHEGWRALKLAGGRGSGM